MAGLAQTNNDWDNISNLLSDLSSQSNSFALFLQGNNQGLLKLTGYDIKF